MKTLAGLLLGLVFLTACTGTDVPQQTPPATPSSSLAVQTPEQLLAEAEAADADARRWAADYTQECERTQPINPMNEELCQLIKPGPNSYRWRWADASRECKEFVGKYNAMVEGGVVARPLIELGKTPNTKARVPGSDAYYPITCEGLK